MPRQTLQNLLRPTTTPEQLLLLDWFYSQFDFRTAGANRHIVNVEPLFYQGAIAGTEFLVYAATKLYICYAFIGGGLIGGTSGTAPGITFYNEADGVMLTTNVEVMIYNAVELHKALNNKIENFYFSRFVTAGYTTMKFNGYRITLD